MASLLSSTQAWRIGLINGPNMSNLGRRDKAIYGPFNSIGELEDFVERALRNLECELTMRLCSNHEGEIVEWIHHRRDDVDGLLVNPAGLSAVGQPMRDALRDCGLPWIEVHCGNLAVLKQQSIFTDWASGTCHGMKGYSYVAGAAGLVGVLEELHAKAEPTSGEPHD